MRADPYPDEQAAVELPECPVRQAYPHALKVWPNLLEIERRMKRIALPHLVCRGNLFPHVARQLPKRPPEPAARDTGNPHSVASSPRRHRRQGDPRAGGSDRPYALLGGLATMLRGRPRFTQDGDILLTVPQVALPGLLDELTRRGFSLDADTVIREFVQHHMTAFRFGVVRIDWLKPVLPLYAHALAALAVGGGLISRRRRAKAVQPTAE